MKAEVQFRIVISLALMIAGVTGLVCAFIYANYLITFAMFLLTILLLTTFDMVSKMRCRNPPALYNESVMAQRDILAWYVNNAMHEYKSPAYHEIVIAALYDKGKSFITELAKIMQLAEEESRENLIADIQNQMGEWELILNQLRERMNHLQSMRRS